MLEQVVETIHFYCDHGLLESYLDLDLHDLHKSIEAYRKLCHERLCREYGLQADACYSGPRIQVNNQTDHPDIPYVEMILEEFLPSDAWKVPCTAEPWTPQDAWEKKQFPIGIIRWACVEGLIRNAKQADPVWIFPPSDAVQFFKKSVQGDFSYTMWKVSTNSQGQLELISVNYALLTEFLLQPTRFLLTNPIDIGAPQSFSRECSYIDVVCGQSEIQVMYWQFVDTGLWGGTDFGKYARAFVNESKKKNLDADFQKQRSTPYSVWLKFTFPTSKQVQLQNILNESIKVLKEIDRETKLYLAGGPIWEKIHDEKEEPFCKDILEPLLKRIFYDARYNHSGREFGKDFILTLKTRLGVQYGALQAKAGKLDGAAGGKLDQVLNQLDDAFTMPYKDPETGESRFISFFMVATSGEITDNAKDKLWWKLFQQGKLGIVKIWDKETIIRLIREVWLDNRQSFDEEDWSVKSSFMK